MIPSRLLLASLLAVAACAHAPERAAPAAGGPAPPERVLVTGSRIPRPVDPRTGRPALLSPVQIHTREELLRTGSSGDLAAALRRLDPSLRP